MLSFKEWRSLCESNNYTLGLAQPQTLGVVGGGGLQQLEELLAEKRKMKKKMLDDKVLDDTDEDETGDGEMVEPSALKDKPKDCDHDHDDDDDGDDHGDEMGDDDVDTDDNGEPAGDDPLRSKLLMMKKKMKKKMCGKSMKKKMKAESEEATELKISQIDLNASQNEFLNKLNAIYSYNKGVKNSSGLAEDIVFPANDANADLAKNEEPGPGEPGFAPQQMIAQL